MATQKQTNANRQNAKKSTGPRTREGKRRASRNATKHGLSAKEVLLPGEDAAEFERLRDGFIEVLEPRNEVELALVPQMVAAEGRMRRVDRVERITIEHRIHREGHLRADDLEGVPDDKIDERLSGILFYAESVQGDAVSKYARYSNAFNRQFHRAYKLLQERQVEPEPDHSENDKTKPISDKPYEIQRDTAVSTNPNGPHAPPEPAQSPGNQPREGRQ